MKQAIVALLFAFAAVTQAAADNGLVTRPSLHSVADTIDRLEAAVKDEKFQVFARVDFQALAAANNGKVRPSQILIFGRGGILPPLLPVAPVAAVDLPFKALAWKDEVGKVWLTYNSGEYLMQRHAIVGKDDLAKRITVFMEKFANRAVQ